MTQVIEQDSEVLIHFDIQLKDGSVAESTQDHGKPMKFRLGDGSLTPQFERCLLGLTQGQQASFELAPEDAFGQPNPDNIQHFSRNQFNADIELEAGLIMAFSGPGGQELPGIVKEVAGDSVTVDFNHPLSGVDIIFNVDIVEIIA